MVKVSLLFISVFTLFCFMIPGYILKKTKLVDQHFAKGMSVYTLYVASIAMLMHGFILEFDPKVFKGVAQVFVLSLLVHLLFFLIAKRLFPNAVESQKKVLQFGVIFSNAGYMGIPVISDVFGPEYVIYATAYIMWFNILAYTLGRLLFTNDKKYVSFKKAFINPAVIPIALGVFIYLTGLGGWIQRSIAAGDFVGQILGVFYNVLTILKNTVAPISMIIIGAKLADINFKGILKDKYMYPFVLIRLFLFPTMVWAILRLLHMVGIVDETVMSVILILSSTPGAAMTTMFAELYNGDAPYAGKLVALTTILSVATMPIVALLLYI